MGRAVPSPSAALLRRCASAPGTPRSSGPQNFRSLEMCGLMRSERKRSMVFVTRLSRTVSRKTARNVMDTLSAILRKAKQWGYVCEGVDFRTLQFAENAVRREPRFFTAKQVQQIIGAAP